jgi:hypothetical protein
MGRALFRKEALAHQQESAISTVTFLPPPSYKVYTALALITLMAAVLLLTVVTFPQRETFWGVLVSRGAEAPTGEKRLHALLYVPSEAIGRLQLGQAVRLQYQGLPERVFGRSTGRVAAISSQLLLPQELGALAPKMGAAFALEVHIPRTTAVFQGRRMELRKGMPLRGEIVTARQTLWHWIWRKT